MPLSGEPLVVTGMGAHCALGAGPDAVFEEICAGRCGISDGTPWLGAGPTARLPGEWTSSGLAVQTARQALVSEPERTRMALVGASTAGDMRLAERAIRAVYLEHPAERPDHLLRTQLCHVPTAAVAEQLGVGGPCLTVSTACTSGTMAIAMAASTIRAGRADSALVLGVDTLCRITVHGFASLGILAPRPCRPFDAHRAGMSIGEGAGTMLIEPLSRAEARGAEIFAVLAGAASAGDAYHASTPHPQGRGLVTAMRCALDRAGVNASDLDYVNAHGTGTILNDSMETVALGQVAPGVPVSSIKGSIGHTLAAAGILEAIITIVAMRRGILPPNAGLEDLVLDLPVVRDARRADIDVAMTVNSAFGGHNAALVLRREPR